MTKTALVSSLNKPSSVGSSILPSSDRERAGYQAEKNSATAKNCREFFGSAPGPIPSNTGPSNRQGLELGGIDWLEFSYFGGWNESKASKLRQRLEDCRAAAESGNEGRAILGDVDGSPVVVKGKGCSYGGTSFRFLLEWQGIQFAVRLPRHVDEKFPTMRVIIPGTVLLEHGHAYAVTSVRCFADHLGFVKLREQITRVDLCADIIGKISEVMKYVDFNSLANSRFVSRAGFQAVKAFYKQDGTPATIQLTTNPVKVRIYDKLLEVQHQPEKLALMIDRRWGGVQPKHAFRVEFELHREILREKFHVDTYEELVAQLAAMAEWATTEYFRLVDDVPDRRNRHQDRSKIAAIWKHVIKTFAGWVGVPGVTPPRKEPLAVDLKKLRQQAMGTMISLASRTGVVIKSVADLARWSGEEFTTLGGLGVAKFNEKVTAIAASVPSSLIGSVEQTREKALAWLPKPSPA